MSPGPTRNWGLQTVDRLSRLVSDLRSTGADEDAWPGLMQGLGDYLGALEVTLGGGVANVAPSIVAPRTDPADVARYLAEYNEQNLLMRDLMLGTPGRVIVDAEMQQFEEFKRSPIYQDWCLPLGFRRAFGSPLATAEGWRGAVMVNTTDAPTPGQIEAFLNILPELTRALDLRALAGRMRASHRAMLDVLERVGQGALLLDMQGRMIDANGLAEAALSSGQLCLRQSRLGCPDAAGDKRLAQLVAAGLAGDSGRIEIAGPAGSLMVSCSPYPASAAMTGMRRPAVIVIVTDPQERMQRRKEALRMRYQLTQAEVALTMAILETGSRKLAAERRGVSVSTARAQLSSIFGKTGAAGQAELVRLVMELD